MIDDDQRVSPVLFEYDETERALRVEWGDGAVQLIAFEALRKGCPCAVCKGEMGRPGRFDVRPDLSPGEDELADIALIGNYGLGARWGDGHDTGIYTFEYLRELGDAAMR